jgi:hypothetical protein
MRDIQMFMSDIAIEGVRDGDLAEILQNYERFWGDRDLPRYLHHPMFFLEFRDTAFVARDLDTGEIAGYLLGFVAPAAMATSTSSRSGTTPGRSGWAGRCMRPSRKLRASAARSR